MDTTTADPTLFTERFNLLRHRFRPLQRDTALTAKEVCDLVWERTARRVSLTHVSYLINGKRQPSLEMADLLAKAFGVNAAYFTEPDVSAIQADLDAMELWRQLREANVTAMAARMKDATTAELTVFADFVTAELNRRRQEAKDE